MSHQQLSHTERKLWFKISSKRLEKWGSILQYVRQQVKTFFMDNVINYVIININLSPLSYNVLPYWGWSGGVMVLGKLPVPGHPTIWMIVGQGPIVFAVGAGGGCLDIFTLVCPISPLSPFLWEMARYRLKYCLKGP